MVKLPDRNPLLQTPGFASSDTIRIIAQAVTVAGHDLNARRTKRYPAIAHAPGARPVVVINKSDLGEDLPSFVDEIVRVAAMNA